MATMQVTGFDGVLFSSLTLTVVPMLDILEMSYPGTYISVVGGMPQFAGTNYGTIAIPCMVEFGGQADVMASIRAFQRTIRVDLGTERMLTGVLNDGTPIQILCRPKAFQRIGPGYLYLVVWEASNYWKSTTATSASITGPASAGGTVARTITMAGTVRALPKVTLTPQLPKTSGTVIYEITYLVTEQDGVAYSGAPYTITWDHAAAVSASQSTAGATDILIYINGAPVNRSVTEPNTSATRVTFPLTITANTTATIRMTFAPSGQTYAGGAYAEAGEWALVTENNSGTAGDYAYPLTIDHASYVSAGYSQASGADIRVWVDGVEVDRGISGANTSSCNIWADLSLAAGATTVVAITMASSGYDYAGATYTKLFDLGTSTTTSIVFTTSTIGFVNSDDTPFNLKPILAKMNGAVSNPANYQVKTISGGIRAEISDTSSSPTHNGNYIRFYGGDIPITNVALTSASTYTNGITGDKSYTRLGCSSDLATWTAFKNYAGALAGGPAPMTYSGGPTAGSTGVIIGLERTTNSESTGTNEYNKVDLKAVTFTLDATKVPTTAAPTDPVIESAQAIVNYLFAGTLTDELGHTITVANVTAPTSWAANTGTLIDSDLSNWTPTGATLTTGVTDPDGGTGAYTIVEDGATSQHKEAITNIAVTDTNTYTIRVRGHANGETLLVVNLFDRPYSGGVTTRFDLSGGTVDSARDGL